MNRISGLAIIQVCKISKNLTVRQIYKSAIDDSVFSIYYTKRKATKPRIIS